MLPVLGEHDAVRCAYQQLASQFILQSLDVLTDGGLGDKASGGGDAERKRLCYIHKRT